ncbi:MAG: hypothetical protein HY270_12430 [Deltaproteobacteria bacterium]|nr:hypothetical protein [Deltaproteobacteria bacterium]
MRLFSAFVADRDLTQTMLARADAITATLKESAASPNDKGAPNAPAPQNKGGGSDQKNLDTRMVDLQRKLQNSTTLGLPIGIRYYPWCQDDGAVDPACSTTENAEPFTRLLLFMRWVLAVTLAGVLIGLGGPFWFDVYSKLSQFMKTSGDQADKSAQADDTPASIAGSKYPNAAKLAPLFVAAAELAAAVESGKDLIAKASQTSTAAPPVNGQ